MKTLALIFVYTLFFISINGQNSDCSTAMTVCQGDSIPVSPNGFGLIEEFTTTHDISNPSINPNALPGNSGCLLSGELNSTWIVFTIVGAGTLEFSLGTLTMPGCLDWIMWPYDSTSCDGIFNNTLPPVACNWNGACSGLSGMALPVNLPVGANQADFEYGLNVNVGDQFILCFSNYSAQSFNLPFSSFGTSSFICSNGGVGCDSSSLSIDSIGVTNDDCLAICNGSIVAIGSDISDSVMYSVNNGLTNYTGTFDSLCSGSYLISFEDSLGCVLSANVTVTSPAPPVMSISDSSFLSCIGSCETVNANGMSSYSWIENNVVISNDSSLVYCPDSSSVIYVIGYDTMGCFIDTLMVNYAVTVNNSFITPQVDTVVLGDSIQICLNNLDTLSTSVWFNGDSSICTQFYPTVSGDYCVYVTDSCGHTDMLCSYLTVGDTTGIQENIGASVRLLNTVTKDGFNIEITNNKFRNLRFSVLDATGKLVLTKPILSTNTYVNISSLPAGIYIVTIRNSDGRVFAGKVVKE